MEHYDIIRARRTGYGTRNADTMVCPVCGEELTEDDDVFIALSGTIIGCCYCVRSHSAAEEFIYKE